MLLYPRERRYDAVEPRPAPASRMRTDDLFFGNASVTAASKYSVQLDGKGGVVKAAV